MLGKASSPPTQLVTLGKKLDAIHDIMYYFFFKDHFLSSNFLKSTRSGRVLELLEGSLELVIAGLDFIIRPSVCLS